MNPIHIIVPILLIAAYIGIAYLWNAKYRPRQISRGNPTDKFSRSSTRLWRFIFTEDKAGLFEKKKKEDSNPADDEPKEKTLFKKLAVWNNYYIFTLLLTILFFIVKPDISWVPALFFICPIVARAPHMLKTRQQKLMRMFAVANSTFRYGRNAEMDPWANINVKKWIGATTPGETIIQFPPSWAASPMSQDAFETHFSQTVTDQNTWTYKWDIAKGNVTMTPVGHIPSIANYPGSADRPWNEIPLGLGAGGEIVWDVKSSPHALIAGKSGGGKSVAQRNIVFHTIQHNDKWCFLGVDPKKVELKPYKKYKNTVLGIGTTLEDMVEIIRYAKEEMMRRYETMEELEVNHFEDLPEPPRAILLMVDEAYMLMAPEGNKTDQGKENDQLHGEASILIGEIARLGRAAGVHLVLAMQRPDAVVLKGEIKNNLEVRIAAGRLDATPSSMVLDNGLATRVPNIRGRGVAQINGDGQLYQGYFAKQSWIDTWLMDHPEREPEVAMMNAGKHEPVIPEDLSDLEEFNILDEDDSQIDENSEDEELNVTRIDDSSDFLAENSAREDDTPKVEQPAKIQPKDIDSSLYKKEVPDKKKKAEIQDEELEDLLKLLQDDNFSDESELAQPVIEEMIPSSVEEKITEQPKFSLPPRGLPPRS